MLLVLTRLDYTTSRQDMAEVLRLHRLVREKTRILGNLFEGGEPMDFFRLKPWASFHSPLIQMLVPLEVRGRTR